MSNELNLKPVKDMTYAEAVGELESILQMIIIAKTKCAVFKNEMCKNFNFSQHQTM